MIEEAQRWWKDGERDIERARKMSAGEDWAGCAFYCQQAVEKWLKALLASRHENAWGHEVGQVAEPSAGSAGRGPAGQI